MPKETSFVLCPSKSVQYTALAEQKPPLNPHTFPGRYLDEFYTVYQHIYSPAMLTNRAHAVRIDDGGICFVQNPISSLEVERADRIEPQIAPALRDIILVKTCLKANSCTNNYCPITFINTWYVSISLWKSINATPWTPKTRQRQFHTVLTSRIIVSHLHCIPHTKEMTCKLHAVLRVLELKIWEFACRIFVNQCLKLCLVVNLSDERSFIVSIFMDRHEAHFAKNEHSQSPFLNAASTKRRRTMSTTVPLWHSYLN